MASKIALTLLAVGGFLSLGMTNAQASIFLGASSESNDINAINDVVPGAGFTGENLLGKIDTDELSPDEGSLIDFFSVHGGTDPDPVNWGDSPGGVEFADEDLYVQFWFENLPVMLEEPFYITIKYATTTDVYEWSTDNGDVKEQNPDGTWDYHSMVYTDDGKSISHVGVSGRLVPEPTSLTILALGLLGVSLASRRRTR